MGDQERLRTPDAFMKIDGIDGESQDDKHKNEIEVLSFSGMVGNKASIAGGGLGGGVSQHEPLRIVHYVDKASPKLFLACSNGEHIKKAVLSIRKAGKQQQDYLVITLSDVLVSGVHPGGQSRGDELPKEEVAFEYGAIETEYKEQKSDGTIGGSIKSGWDVKKRKSS